MEGKAGEVKYAVKDSVFTLLFSEIGNVRKLYGSLHDDEDNYSDEDFKIITLENALINGQYNDLGFTVRDRLIILVEAQSTFNPNMGVRLLMYIAKSYHGYIIENKLNIFGERLIKLPIPEFIVVYSGAKRQDVNEIRLSDCFESNVSPNIELVVKVIKKDKTKIGILQEYLTFCDMYNRYVKGKKTAKEKFQGLRKVIYECIQNGILGEFLKKHQKEVENMLMTVLSPEQAIEFMKLDEYNRELRMVRPEASKLVRPEVSKSARPEASRLVRPEASKSAKPEASKSGNITLALILQRLCSKTTIALIT